jgi:hypothetical protein
VKHFRPVAEDDCLQSYKEMLTEIPNVPHQDLRCSWPVKFTKRRKFVLRNENQPFIDYIKWLQASFDNAGYEEEGDDNDCGDDGDELSDDADVVDGHEGTGESQDENQIDGKNVGACDELGIVRRFMKGIEGEEDLLQYPDQVEQVASFCEQATFGGYQEHVALLDDRSDSIATLGKQRQYRPNRGPLTVEQLRKELSKEVSKFSLLNQIS